MAANVSITDVYPILPMQKGLLFEGAAHQGDRYAQQIAIRFTNEMDVPRLRRAIQHLVQSQPVLRTIFDWESTDAIQVVLDGITPAIRECVSDNLTLATLQASELASLPKPDAHPPIRFAILSEDSSVVLVITYHHVLMDGPGVGLLIDALLELYRADLPPVAVPDAMKAYVAWSLEHIGNAERGYWRTMLRGLEASASQLTPEPVATSEEVVRKEITLPGTVARRFTDVARRLHVTPAVLMQAIWSHWLALYFNKTALHYGLVQSTRVPGLVDEAALGAFINTIPWFEPHAGTTAPGRLAEAIQERMLTAENAKHVALGTLNTHVNQYASRFNAILTITTALAAPRPYEIVGIRENTGYAIAIDVTVTSQKIVVTCALPEKAAVQQLDTQTLLTSFCTAVEQAVDNTDQCLQLPQRYEPPYRVDALPRVQALTNEQQQVVITVLQEVLNRSVTEGELQKSFIELGGDSVDALKASTALAKHGMHFPVGSLLEAPSVIAAIGTRQTAPVPVHSDATLSVSERVILSHWQAGAGRDFHEQAAFVLGSEIDGTIMRQALAGVASEVASLRTIYTMSENQATAHLQETGRMLVTVLPPTSDPFDSWVNTYAKQDIAQPFDLQQGPLLRIAVSRAAAATYLFMSFPTLISDGWSFSHLLERIFVWYDKVAEGYASPTTSLSLPTERRGSIIPIEEGSAVQLAMRDVEHAVIQLDADTTRTHRLFAQAQGVTLSSLYTAVYCQMITSCMHDCVVGIYDAGRHNESGAPFIGSLGTVLPCRVKASDVVAMSHRIQQELGLQRQRAEAANLTALLAQEIMHYYVFENYPKDIENKLKSDRVSHFKERGEWRRLMLPPAALDGIAVELQTDGSIHILIIARGKQASERIKVLTEAWHTASATIM